MNAKCRIISCIIILAVVGCDVIQARPVPSNSKGFLPSHYSGKGNDSDEDNNDRSPHAIKPPIGFIQQGEASYYGGYWDGRKTANGEIYDQSTLTAAHRTLPFNSRVRVRNLANNKEVVVRINNRGPYLKGRIIDLSVAAANKLDMRKCGVARVEIEVIE